jgi:hypothetical protein
MSHLREIEFCGRKKIGKYLKKILYSSAPALEVLKFDFRTAHKSPKGFMPAKTKKVNQQIY